MTKKLKAIVTCLCVAVAGLGVSTGILAAKFSRSQNIPVTSTSNVANSSYSKMTVDSFLSRYNKATMGEKISKLNEVTLQNGQIVKYCENSNGNVIRLHLDSDKTTIRCIDIRTSSLTPLTDTLNPDFSSTVETIMYISNSKQDCVKILTDLGLLDSSSAKAKSVKVDGINYEYSIETSTDSLSSDIANLTINYS